MSSESEKTPSVDDIERLLRQRGLRLTGERLAIVGEVLRLGHHFRAEGLHDALKTAGLRVSRASVYRTLNILRDAGVIAAVESTAGERSSSYEFVLGRAHHDHMLCTRCGKVIEFYSEDLERLQDRICREHGFEGLQHTLEIMGRCQACRAAGQ